MLKNTSANFILVGLSVIALASGCYYVDEDGVSGNADELTITTNWLEIDHIRSVDGKPLCNGTRDTKGKAIVTYELWVPYACGNINDVCSVQVEKSFDDTSTTEVTFTASDVINKGQVLECMSELGEVCSAGSRTSKSGDLLTKEEVEDAYAETPEEFQEIPVTIEWKDSCHEKMLTLNAWVGVDSVEM